MAIRRGNLQVVAAPAARQGRVNRNPQHPFNLRTKPYQIAPFMIAPVLPGETMRSLNWQSRVVSDPISDDLIGWWKEYYFFYVKLTQMGERDTLTNMLIDPSAAVASLATETANPLHYFNASSTNPGINFVEMALEPIVKNYFRLENEAVDAFMVDGLPAASVNSNTWMDSVMSQWDYDDLMNIWENGLQDDITLQSDMYPGNIMEQQNFMMLKRALGLGNIEYEDYLRLHGVTGAVTRKEDHMEVPELIRYSRDWTYPANSVDAGTNSVRSVLSWSIQERADKDRFFNEPGFVIGVTVTRPKVYMANQTGNATQMLHDMYSWLPGILQGNQTEFQTMRPFEAGTGPLADLAIDGPEASTQRYIVDVRDLYLYGDQFVNHDGPASALPLPSNDDLQRRYATLTMLEGLFSGEANEIREDGIVNLNIAGSQREYTGPTNAEQNPVPAA